jgi:hypothetical protein
MASTRAARIASWMLRIRTMDGDPRQAMVELWPTLRALALEPVRDEDDYIERSAFQADTEPGGNDAKTKNAFRWVPIHPLLCRLGLLARRDAIVADHIARKTSEAGGPDRLSQAAAERIAEEAQQQWLFPDWKVYVLPTGEIRWSQAVSKSWQYVKVKFKMTRKGLALYPARATPSKASSTIFQTCRSGRAGSSWAMQPR